MSKKYACFLAVGIIKFEVPGFSFLDLAKFKRYLSKIKLCMVCWIKFMGLGLQRDKTKQTRIHNKLMAHATMASEKHER